MAEALKRHTGKSVIAIAIAIGVVALLLGVSAGVLHLYMRFANNTREEMFDGSGHIDFLYSAELFAVAFVPVFAFAAIGGAIVLLVLTRGTKARR